MGDSRSVQKEPIRGIMKYTHQQLLRIIENVTFQENGKLTNCLKESIRGMMKCKHQQLLRIIQNITIQENGELTFCSKRTLPGNYEIYTSAAAANHREYNYPREWGTHVLLKKNPSGEL